MNSNKLHTDQTEILFKRLQGLLGEQEQLIKKSDFRKVEILSQQADPIITELVKTELAQQPRWKRHYKQLIRQYKKLELMIEAEKNAVYRQLRKVEAGKKTVQIYQKQ